MCFDSTAAADEWHAELESVIGACSSKSVGFRAAFVGLSRVYVS